MQAKNSRIPSRLLMLNATYSRKAFLNSSVNHWVCLSLSILKCSLELSELDVESFRRYISKSFPRARPYICCPSSCTALTPKDTKKADKRAKTLSSSVVSLLRSPLGVVWKPHNICSLTAVVSGLGVPMFYPRGPSHHHSTISSHCCSASLL